MAPASDDARAWRAAVDREILAQRSITEARVQAAHQLQALQANLADQVPFGMVLTPKAMVHALGEATAALRFMLMVHGGGGIIIGLLLCLDNPHGASFSVLTAIPGWPWTWGLLLASAGTATTVGRLGGWIRVCRFGAWVQTGWYLAQFLGFAAAAWGGGANR